MEVCSSLFVVLVLTIFSGLAIEEYDRGKRILLTDPNYLQQELNQIQAKLQEYEATKNKMTTLEAEVATLNSQMRLIESKAEKGVTYVRRGRHDCSGNGTELVYKGMAGGSWYDHTGAAANYVCLPLEPMWGSHKNIREFLPALMYGAEYEDEILFGMADKNEEVPCAVCRSPNHSTLIMIPARFQCYQGWDEAYHGNLAGGYFGARAASEYVCVDDAPQAMVGGGTVNDDGKLFYQVRTRCGALKCPPYENDKVLSCVVCMK